jgi:Recombinase zinc beta ribbon domain
VLSGPAREGLAVLQGMLLCGSCGRSLTVRYLGNGGIYPTYLCNRLLREGLATSYCMSFRCDLLDAAISEQVLKALQPAKLELALAALHELEVRDQTIFRQWQMRLERAEYDAALAERRYQEVDPSQRLVAACPQNFLFIYRGVGTMNARTAATQSSNDYPRFYFVGRS